jgi:hypothetical protein
VRCGPQYLARASYVPHTAGSGAAGSRHSNRPTCLKQPAGPEAAVVEAASWQVPHQKPKIDSTRTLGKTPWWSNMLDFTEWICTWPIERAQLGRVLVETGIVGP